jgi:hypothetical protein
MAELIEMRLQRALVGFEVRARYVRSSHHIHGSAAVEPTPQTASLFMPHLYLCLETHLISNSHVPPRRSPSSASQSSILENNLITTCNESKMFGIPFMQIYPFVDIFESFQNSR